MLVWSCVGADGVTSTVSMCSVEVAPLVKLGSGKVGETVSAAKSVSKSYSCNNVKHFMQSKIHIDDR